MYVTAYCDNVKLILFDLNQTDANIQNTKCRIAFVHFKFLHKEVYGGLKLPN